MSDLISREELLRKMNERYSKIDNGRAFKGMTIPVVDGVRMHEIEYCIGMIESEDVIDAEPVRHGRWFPVDGEAPCDEWDCTACGRRMTFMVDMDVDDMAETYWRCPKCGAYMCGAKMDGGAEDDHQGT